MSLNIKNKRSAVAGSTPTPAQLEDGEIGVNYNSTDPALYIKDSTGTVVRIAGDGAVGAGVPDATTTVKGKVQLADAAAVTAGTAGRVVDAAQLKVVADSVAAEDLWDRSGTELTPKNAGDDVFTSGDVKVGGTTAAPKIELKSDGSGVYDRSTGGSIDINRNDTNVLSFYNNSGTRTANFGTSGAAAFLGDVNIGGTFSASNITVKSDGGIVANVDGLVYDAATKRLGIGAATPFYPLHVKTTDESGGFLERNNADVRFAVFGGLVTANIGSDYAGQIGWAGTSNNYPFAIKTAKTERCRVDTSGRLLVGTSDGSGTQLLKVNGSTAGAIYGGTMALTQGRTPPNGSSLGVLNFGSEANPRGSTIAASAEGAWTAGSSHPSNLVFYTTASGASTPTERMRIQNDGKIGIGTQSPRFNLSFGSTVTTSTSTPQTIDLGGTYSNSAGQNAKIRVYWDGTSQMGLGASANQFDYIAGSGTSHVFYIAGTERCRLDTSGRLLVGTSTSAVGTRLVVEGNSGGSSLQPGIATLSFSGNAPSDGSALGVVSFADSGHTQAATITARRDAGTWTSGSSQPTRLVFSTTADGDSNPTERLRITSDAYLRLAAGTGGIQFGGDTAAANALDDYEEGTWTVEFYDAVSGGNQSATTTTGTYTKVGRFVHLQFAASNINTTGLTASNQLYFSLPFVGLSSPFEEYNGACAIAGSSLASTPITTHLVSSSSRGYFLGNNTAAGAFLPLQISSITSGANNFRVSLSYMA